MRYPDGRNINARDPGCLTITKHHRAPFRLRCAGKWSNAIVEDVLEAMSQSLERVRRSVHLEWRIAPHREDANIIETMRVSGMIVREEHRVDAVDTRRDQLESELRRRINEKPGARISF